MKEVIVNKTDGSLDFLKDYEGHVYLGSRPYDPGTAAETDPAAIVLQFSDEPAQEQLLKIEDQRNVLRCWRMQCNYGGGNGNYEIYSDLHGDLCDSLIPDIDEDED